MCGLDPIVRALPSQVAIIVRAHDYVTMRYGWLVFGLSVDEHQRGVPSSPPHPEGYPSGWDLEVPFPRAPQKKRLQVSGQGTSEFAGPAVPPLACACGGPPAPEIRCRHAVSGYPLGRPLRRLAAPDLTRLSVRRSPGAPSPYSHPQKASMLSRPRNVQSTKVVYRWTDYREWRMWLW